MAWRLPYPGHLQPSGWCRPTGTYHAESPSLMMARPKEVPDNKVHGANMGPIWGRQDPGGPMLAPWTLLSGVPLIAHFKQHIYQRLIKTLIQHLFYKSVAIYPFKRFTGLPYLIWTGKILIVATGQADSYRCPSSQTDARPSKIITLQWRHNEHDSVSNHQPHDCLLNRLFGRRSKKTPKLRVTGLEFTGDRWIPRTKGQ